MRVLLIDSDLCGKICRLLRGGKVCMRVVKSEWRLPLHSGLLFILFLLVCHYKHGSQIIVQHYVVNDAMRRF